ncbi:MAG TPA: glucose 1-dehydrogenase [Acidimicrobiales bacterium]|nr:glucose 1-dehydrogenase [Acidimicrobiales bacterium]
MGTDKVTGRFQDKVVMVTGSSSGIGEATARAFDAEGAHVVVNSSSSVEAGEAVAGSLASSIYVQADVSDPAACEALVAAAVDRFGRLDVLVNNAGVTQVIAHHDLDAVTDDVLQRILDVNVVGTWRLTRLAMPHLRASGDGSVVNITSIAGLRPTGSSIPYAMSKAALNHMTALLANVTGPEVRVNAVAPGLIRTPWTADWGFIHDAMAERAPLQRSGEPDDVATLVVDLAASAYVTGQVVVVDGGLSLR